MNKLLKEKKEYYLHAEFETTIFVQINLFSQFP